jgi:hypothetical protein
MAIERPAVSFASDIDPRPYELAAMVLRRQRQLDRELDVLLTYFRRALGATFPLKRY